MAKEDLQFLNPGFTLIQCAGAKLPNAAPPAPAECAEKFLLPNYKELLNITGT